MHGSRRVITFCLLTTVLPTLLIILPLYLRNVRYADVKYTISDDDVIQIHQGQSSVFCQKHSLKMNISFNAFQMKGRPKLSHNRRHLKLKKSMILPDDTLEYWGFYLFKGATVELNACSRYEGSKILVVKGERILNTCGILDPNKYHKDPNIANGGHVSVTLEAPTEENSNRSATQENSTKEIYKDTFGEENFSNENEIFISRERTKRAINEKPLHNPNTVLDRGVHHGGNAFNSTKNTDASLSSFEHNLYECYNGNILINEYFPFSSQCNNTDYLERTTTLKVTHEVLLDGYYYYIFYSDNDIVKNDIHAIFDIYKPTFQYDNLPLTKICVNKTECEFDVGLFSNELVIVEMPNESGLTIETDNPSILISTCEPRVTVYIIFPISVLLMILLFAFL